MKLQIHEILKRYVGNECSAQEAEQVEKWLLANLTSPDADEIFERLLFDIHAQEEPERKEAARQRLNRFIDDTLENQRRSRRKIRKIIGSTIQYAAIAALVFVSAALYRQLGETQSWNEVYAPYGEVKEVTLPDNSVIWLHADSKIVYPDRFGRSRQIYASGEIYASIARDKRRPFTVTSNGADVRVLGTEFNLKSYSDTNNIEVTLVEGSVALSVPDKNHTQEYLLAPGDMIRVDKSSGIAELYRFDTDEYTSWRDKRALYFINSTLEEIVAELQRSFNVTIAVDAPVLLKTRYLATFVNEEPLDQILDALNSDGNMEITRRGELIVISQAGGQ